MCICSATNKKDVTVGLSQRQTAMFTGIIETTGKVISLEKEKSNLQIGMATSIAKELKIGQSVAHNGVCLTIEKIFPSKKIYFVTSVQETLDKTNLGSLKKGSVVNLERSLKIGDRLDGHFVQGHVDCTAEVTAIKKENGSWLFEFKVKSQKSKAKSLIIEKGSICVNGVSLTVVEVKRTIFSVAIIPHTFQRTNFSSLKKGDAVNIEFDILGKHINKILKQDALLKELKKQNLLVQAKRLKGSFIKNPKQCRRLCILSKRQGK